jgi:2-polyprenyl-3-methyl-5-hydroxy-6-metoxy-1,4-benzoquinol methylase
MCGEAEVRRLWDSNAATWSGGVRRAQDNFRRLFHDPFFYPLMGDVAGQSLLDLGCGEGICCRRSAELGATVTGIDISENMIAHAQRLEQETPQGIAYHVGSFTDLRAVEENRFDAAISVMALMDSPNIEKAFAEAHRVLRPGGRMVFSICHPFTDGSDTRWDEEEGALLVKNYFNREPWLSKWAFGGSTNPAHQMEVMGYPRTLSEYFTAALDCGFTIAKVLEPSPSAEAVATEPRLAQWQRVPFSLMVKLHKVGS